MAFTQKLNERVKIARDYFGLIQSIGVVAALTMAAYVFFAAPVDSGTYRTEENKMGWIYLGRSDGTAKPNLKFISEKDFKASAGTLMKVVGTVHLRAAPRTPIQQIIGSHHRLLGTLAIGSTVCVRDIIKSGVRSVWLYIRVIDPASNRECETQ